MGPFGRPRLIRCGFAVLAVAFAVPCAAQTTFRAGVSIVPLAVRVLDANGNPVTNLSPSDFVVLENGVPQPLLYFDPQRFDSQRLADKAAAAKPAGLEAASTARLFLIGFGRGRLQFPKGALDAALDFVRTKVTAQDRVAVIAFGRVTLPTSNHEATAKLIERYRDRHELIDARIRQYYIGVDVGWLPLPDYIRREVDAVFDGVDMIPTGSVPRDVPLSLGPADAGEVQRRRATLDTLRDLPGTTAVDIEVAASTTGGASLDEFLALSETQMADGVLLGMGFEYLRHLEGEKHFVVLMERGFMSTSAERLASLAHEASQARIALHLIYTGGVDFRGDGNQLARLDPFYVQRGQAGSFLAKETGGTFYANRFANAVGDFTAIERASRFQYMLGYLFNGDASNSEYRRIEVRVNRPGVTVHHRQGYQPVPAPPTFDARDRAIYARVATAGTYFDNLPGIGVAASIATTSPSGLPHSATVEATVDLRDVEFTERNGRHHATIEVAVFCYGARNEDLGQSWERLELNLSTDRLESLADSGLSHAVTLQMAVPPTAAKVVIYDHASGRIGSRSLVMKSAPR